MHEANPTLEDEFRIGPRSFGRLAVRTTCLLMSPDDGPALLIYERNRLTAGTSGAAPRRRPYVLNDANAKLPMLKPLQISSAIEAGLHLRGALLDLRCCHA
jgi:hypothetical protein